MDFITDQIAIGDTFDAEDIVGLRDRGIRSVISLNGQLGRVSAAQMGLEALLTIRLGDGWLADKAEFEEAVKGLERFATTHSPVLVHCTEGRSRSVMVVAAHLMRAMDLSFEEAVGRIRDERPYILPTQVLRCNWKVDDQWPVQRED